MKFRKKPVVIEAVQYTEYGKLVKGMCNSQSCYTSGNTEPHVHTIHNNQMVLLEVGDYVIPEPDGEHYYPCKPGIFEKTYDEVNDEQEALPCEQPEKKQSFRARLARQMAKNVNKTWEYWEIVDAVDKESRRGKYEMGWNKIIPPEVIQALMDDGFSLLWPQIIEDGITVKIRW